MDKGKFINSIKQGALKGYSQHRIMPSLTMAQAILESAWGNSGLSQKANNLFGIKANPGWGGKRITMETTEWYGNKKQRVKAEFRAYDSFNESMEDHSRLLSYNRYKPVSQCKDYKSACQKIYECGYATDPEYPKKLIRLIEENKLYEFDKLEDDKVLRFQRLCNELNIRDCEGKALAEDNSLGWRTKSCIEKIPVLKAGSRGASVKFVQYLVNAEPVDGSFGPVTKKRVMEYQRDNNLKVDGIVGVQTWTRLVQG
jgi:peptidoglycan hydrolase-like protein with peptidoglycan-binding domain